MKRRPSFLRVPAFAALFAGFLLAGGVRGDTSVPAEISFTLQKMVEHSIEGPDVERTYFTAGDKCIVIGPPKGARLRVEDGGLVVLLSDAGLDGEIHVVRSDFSPDLDFVAEVEKYREAAAKKVPSEATGVIPKPPLLNAYPFNGWKSQGFSFAYALGGRPMVRTVSFINLEIGKQIMVTTIASKADAAKVYQTAQQFLSSWWVMGADRH